MLSRRNTRIKTMQILYSLDRNPFLDLKMAESNLVKKLDAFLETYYYILFTATEVIEFINTDASIKASKYLRKEKDEQISLKFLDNYIYKDLIGSERFTEFVDKHKFRHTLTPHVISSLFKLMNEDDNYKAYMSNKLTDAKDDRTIFSHLILNIILKADVYDAHLEDIYSTWQDDKEFLLSFLHRQFSFTKKSNKAGLAYKTDKKYDEIKNFALELLRKTHENDTELKENISGYLKNWDSNRLALVDTILMKMALAELLYFPEIPVKVSINEYIDISKIYSTPKSKEFVNGVLDKVMRDLTDKGKIVKTGRGLIQ